MEKVIDLKSADGKVMRLVLAEGEDALKDITALNILRVEGAEVAVVVPPKVEKADIKDIKRFMGEEVWDARTAAEALTSIIYLLSSEAQETHPEAAGQIEDLKVVIQKLKSFIASEIMETGTDVTANSPMVLYAMGRLDDVFRKGSRHNEADMKSIQAIHDHTVSLGVDCGGTVEKAEKADIQRGKDLEVLCVAAGEEITRIKKDYDDLVTLGNAVVEENTKLKAEPSKGKGPINRIVSREDPGDGEVMDGLVRIEDTSGIGVEVLKADEAEYKAAISSGDQMRAAKLVMKAQHLKPMRATV